MANDQGEHSRRQAALTPWLPQVATQSCGSSGVFDDWPWVSILRCSVSPGEPVKGYRHEQWVCIDHGLREIAKGQNGYPMSLQRCFRFSESGFG